MQITCPDLALPMFLQGLGCFHSHVWHIANCSVVWLTVTHSMPMPASLLCLMWGIPSLFYLSLLNIFFPFVTYVLVLVVCSLGPPLWSNGTACINMSSTHPSCLHYLFIKYCSEVIGVLHLCFVMCNQFACLHNPDDVQLSLVVITISLFYNTICS